MVETIVHQGWLDAITAMKTGVNYVIFDTAAGWIGISASARGLLRTTLPQSSMQKACQIVGAEHATWSPHLFEDVTLRLKSYFRGHEVKFTDSLDLSPASAFQRQVWEATRLIPYANTRSYGWVAEQIGKPEAARAVGQALARNPLPIIIPCHRVLTRSGELGGFSGGLKMKKHLLRLESTAGRR